MMFIARPTEVLKSYVKSKKILPHGVGDVGWQLGRLSVGLEILTVIKTLEDQRVPMLALQREETISVLQTLLRETGLEDSVSEWYEMLGEWCQPKFVAVDASLPEGTADAAAPGERIRAQRGIDQSRDLPSGESAEAFYEGEPPMLSE